MVFIGAEPLHAFSLAITFGLLSATYTTLLIVAPFYYYLTLLMIFIRNKKIPEHPKGDLESTETIGDVEANDGKSLKEAAGYPSSSSLNDPKN